MIAPFVKRDLLAFNRMRSAILNQIDSWWRNHGALAMVDGGVADAPWKSMARMMNADYRVSGLPQPSCPPGYGSLFFNKDPSDPTAKIVDPYIVAADGSLVENPNAVRPVLPAQQERVRHPFRRHERHVQRGRLESPQLPRRQRVPEEEEEPHREEQAQVSHDSHVRPERVRGPLVILLFGVMSKEGDTCPRHIASRTSWPSAGAPRTRIGTKSKTDRVSGTPGG
eukprot:jgi/Mesvir1/8940/Mv06654-RA.1